MAHMAQERGHGAAESLTCSRHSGQQASRIPDCLQACTILHHLDRVLLGSLVSKTKGKTRKPKVSKATRSIMTESNKSGRNRWKETNQIEHYDSTSCTFHFWAFQPFIIRQLRPQDGRSLVLEYAEFAELPSQRSSVFSIFLDNQPSWQSWQCWNMLKLRWWDTEGLRTPRDRAFEFVQEHWTRYAPEARAHHETMAHSGTM